MDISNKRCIPCEVGGKALNAEEVLLFTKDLADWSVEDNAKISRKFKFKTFKEAIIFVNLVAEIAESQGHHPDIHVYFNEVTLELQTHAVKGLTENDFIMAARINKIS